MSQYKFIETNKNQTGVPLPSEAMTFGGVTIENAIRGYRTLTVSGRELIANDLDTYKVGGANGERYSNSRKPSRTITVKYQLIADTPQEFRYRFNQLNMVLDSSQVPFSFADEPDKYFVGSKSTVDAVPDGINQIVSSFDIFCADPFKYSEVDKRYDTATDKLSIDNQGTHESYPSFEIIPSTECGFVGLINQNGETISVGKIDEPDGNIIPKSRIIINDPFDSFTGWDLNKNKIGLRTINTASGTYTHLDGTVVPNYATPAVGWNGPVASKEFVTTAKNWRLSVYPQFATLTNAYRAGTFECNVVAADGEVIAGFTFNNRQGGINYNRPEFFVGGTDYLNYSKTATEWNNFFGNLSIKKEGAQFTFTLTRNGTTQQLARTYVREDRRNKIPAKVVFWFGRYQSQNWMNNNKMAHLTFEVTDEDYFVDIYNTFQPNDIIRIENGTKNIYVNGVRRLDLGQLGNKYFTLYPGKNDITILKSTWAQQPKTTLINKEAWL